MPNDTYIGCRMEPELIERIKRVAAEEERTPSQLLRMLAKRHVEEAEAKKVSNGRRRRESAAAR